MADRPVASGPGCPINIETVVHVDFALDQLPECKEACANQTCTQFLIVHRMRKQTETQANGKLKKQDTFHYTVY